MSLMSLVRWIGVVVIAWTLVAIGIGAFRHAARAPRAARVAVAGGRFP